jgi:hypothetical protein
MDDDQGGDRDVDLLRRTMSGDEGAFVGLYRRHRDPLYRFSRRMLGNPEEAEDVVRGSLPAGSGRALEPARVKACPSRGPRP